MSLNERRTRLETLLLETAPLWQASTFRERRPAWCAEHPALTNALLALDENGLAALDGDPLRSIPWLKPYIPALGEIPSLTQLPSRGPLPRLAHPQSDRGIPGRKAGQIEAFVGAVGRPLAPLVEWCAGKGHLGRRFLAHWEGDALAVERNPALCASGEAIARTAGSSQRFLSADVLDATTGASLRGGHAVALHACGDLHRRLIQATAETRAPALDVAPCCYHLTAHASYRPLCPDSALTLNRLAMKLAVTETVTASPRKTTDSAKASAWKLAFLALRDTLTPDSNYRPFRPVPAAWLSRDFATFLACLAARENVPLSPGLDVDAFEETGWQRHHESRRLQLVRMAFRRALEIWILCDLAVWMELQGYTVTLREFCSRPLTPRNLLLSARLHGLNNK